MQETIIQNVLKKKIIAIVRGMGPEHIVSLGRALYEGGINMVEVTFDQKSTDHYAATTSAIEALREQMDGKILVGAGTVLSTEQADLAKAAGALYVITPTVDPDVIRHVKKIGLVAMPGALTPTEAMQARDAGADFVKIFPAGNMGPAYIKAIRAPLSHIPLLAVGGINEKNIGDFLAAGCVGAGCGGQLVNKSWIEAGEFQKITQLASAFCAAAGVS